MLRSDINTVIFLAMLSTYVSIVTCQSTRKSGTGYRLTSELGYGDCLALMCRVWSCDMLSYPVGLCDDEGMELDRGRRGRCGTNIQYIQLENK